MGLAVELLVVEGWLESLLVVDIVDYPSLLLYHIAGSIVQQDQSMVEEQTKEGNK